MEKYNEHNKCPKCNNPARTKYLYSEEIEKLELIPGVEYIQRKCFRCGFTWYEEPLKLGHQEKTLSPEAIGSESTPPEIKLEEKPVLDGGNNHEDSPPVPKAVN